MLHKRLGVLAALAVLAVAACSGGGSGPNPIPAYPSASASSLSSSITTFTLNPVNNVNSQLGLTGSGQVSVTASSGAPSGPGAIPAMLHRDGASPSASSSPASSPTPIYTGANTEMLYLTVTASGGAATLTQLGPLSVAVPSAPPTNAYVAYWDGSKWVAFSTPGKYSGGTLQFSGITDKPLPVSLSSGQSFYVAVYIGQQIGTPPPAAPVVSPTSMQVILGTTQHVTVTSKPGFTVTAKSDNTAVATVDSSASVGNDATASFGVYGAGVGSATITFTDKIGQTATLKVTVADVYPTPMPSPGSVTISLGNSAPVTITTKPGTPILGSSSNTGVATVNAAVTADANGTASFIVTGVGPGTATITFTDPNNQTGTLSVTVSAIKNGSFTKPFSDSSNGWTACSYAHTAQAVPVNPSTPMPPTPIPSQNPTNTTTPVPLASIAPLLATTAAPDSDNPNAKGTPPPALAGATVALLGSLSGAVTAYPRGEFGMCQTFTVPATTPYLSFWVWEGGTNYNFATSDQEARILDSTGTNVLSSLFIEQNCYVDPANGIGSSGIATTSGCWPSVYNGDTNGYKDWVGGGFWSPRGPYDLSSYAGQTITLYLGQWSSYLDNLSKYAAFMYVGNVQLNATNAFPASAPYALRGRKVTLQLSHR